MTKNRVGMRRLRQGLTIRADASERELKNSLAPNDVDRWSGRAANWAQVLMLALVAFGYFYTVRPVYQKDLLEEDVARLTLEQTTLEKNNQLVADRAKSLQDNLADLKSQQARLRSKNLSLAARNTLMAGESSRMAAELSRTRSLTESQEEQLRTGQSLILKENFDLRAGYLVASNEEMFDTQPFLGRDSAALDKWVSTKFVQPIDQLLAEVDGELEKKTYFGLPEPHGISEELVQELRRRLESTRDELTCPTPDRRAWQAAFESQVAQAKATTAGCVQMHFDHLVKDQAWTPLQVASLKSSGYWKRQAEAFNAACESVSDFFVAQRFNEKWAKFMRPCTTRVFYASELMEGRKRSDIEVFANTDPPPMDREWYRSWYDRGAANDSGKKAVSP